MGVQFLLAFLIGAAIIATMNLTAPNGALGGSGMNSERWRSKQGEEIVVRESGNISDVDVSILRALRDLGYPLPRDADLQSMKEDLYEGQRRWSIALTSARSPSDLVHAYASELSGLGFEVTSDQDMGEALRFQNGIVMGMIAAFPDEDGNTKAIVSVVEEG